MFARLRLTRIVIKVLLLLFAWQLSCAHASPRIVGRELIVKLRASALPSDRDRALRNSVARPMGSKDLSRQGARGEAPSTLLLTLQEGVSASSEIARLQQNPAVEFVEPNYPVKLFTNASPVIPSDFDFARQYSLLNPGGGDDAKTNADIHATEAWRYTTGSKRVIVAVIDTGIDYLHEDLRDNIWTNTHEIPDNGIDDDGNGYIDDFMGYDFVSGDSDPFDDNEHGTHVAGIIGARGDNGVGIAGVCWEVSLMALKAFDQDGNGTVEDVIAAIKYAVQNGARIINASWGLEEKSRALEEAVQAASDAGVLFVAAAGNNRSDAPSYPASFDSVLSVAATDKRDMRAIFSNYGPTVDIAAPGDAIYSTLPENSYGMLSGTSMAAPHVAGVAALVLSRFPNYSRQELFDILINSVDVVPFDQPVGNGRLDASRAVRMDQPLPVARLQIPSVLSGKVPVLGTALGTYAQTFGILFGAGKMPTNWLPIASGSARVTNGLLAELDTALIPDGAAIVQLVVTNQNGATAVVNTAVKVLNALVSAPLSGDIIAPGLFEIKGTVYGENKKVELFYGSGLNPKVWIKLPNVTSGATFEGKLGEWDTRGLSNGFYGLRLLASNGTNDTEFLAPAIYVDHHLRPGWPVPLGTDEDFPLAEWRNVRVADLDGDGQAELIVVESGTRGREQKLAVFAGSGQLLWSHTLGFDIPPDVPAIGDVDGDGRMEIFVDGPNSLEAFHADGSPVPGWPVRVTTRNHAKVLADLNRDGKLELITFSQEYSATQVPDLRELSVFAGNGSLVRKWQLPWCGSTNDVQKIFPAVGNIDDDPELEIVAVSGCSDIAAYDYRRPDPKWTASSDGGVFLSSPVIGDVDGDGRPDIVVTAALENNAETGGIYVFRGDGQRWRGWPVLEEYSFTSSPVLGDLDHDGRLEIVAASIKESALHVLQWDGFEADGWPRDTFHNSSARVGLSLADVDGDGTADIVAAAPGFTGLAISVDDPLYVGGITVLNAAGDVLPLNGSSNVRSLQFESYTPYRTHKASPPVLGDFDGDGRLDMAFCSLQSRTYGTNLKLKKWSSAYSWRLGTPLAERSLEWPMFAHDIRNSGTYSLPPFILPPPTNSTLAVRDRILGLEDKELLITPLGNDVGAPPLAIESITTPAHGKVTQNGSAELVYSPEKDFSGFDDFRYTMRDALGRTSSARIFVRIKPFNDPPVAHDIELTMKKNSSVSVFYSATDPENDKMTFRIVDGPSHGELWTYPSVGTYYPTRGFFGTDVIHYTASDAKSESAPATVTIQVLNSNNPPTAASQSFLTKTNRAVRILPAATDLDDDEVTFELVTGPQHGAVETDGNGFRFIPETNFLGSDSFSVRPFDGTAYGDPAAMNITVIATNATPKAPSGSAVVSPNTTNSIRLPGSDPDGDPITFTVVTPPLHGTLSGTPPKLTYLPATNYLGPDKLTFKVSDGFAETQPATFTLQVVRQNRVPRGDDQTVSTITGAPVQIELSLTDPDSDPLRTVILKGPRNGLLYGSGTHFTYVPDPDRIGSDSFTYKGWDGQKFGNVTRVTVLVSLPPQELPPNFLSISREENVVELLLSTPNARPFFIESSSNLVDWTNLAGPLVSDAEKFTFRDTNRVDAALFYRARRKN